MITLLKSDSSITSVIAQDIIIYDDLKSVSISVGQCSDISSAYKCNLQIKIKLFDMVSSKNKITLQWDDKYFTSV